MAGNAGNGSGRRKNRWRGAVWGTAALLLLLPLVAMQFSEEVAWGVGDFVVFGAVLAGACGTYELAARMTGNRTYRTAVGIIGDEGNPANLMFGGVLAGLGLPSSGPAARLFENVGRERTPAGAMP